MVRRYNQGHSKLKYNEITQLILICEIIGFWNMIKQQKPKYKSNTPVPNL